MAKLKPWTPGVMADHYKKEEKKYYQDNLHPKTFSAKLHKK
jgi:hypothetical protein